MKTSCQFVNGKSNFGCKKEVFNRKLRGKPRVTLTDLLAWNMQLTILHAQNLNLRDGRIGSVLFVVGWAESKV
jgi:hypothetical protein